MPIGSPLFQRPTVLLLFRDGVRRFQLGRKFRSHPIGVIYFVVWDLSGREYGGVSRARDGRFVVCC